MKHLRYFKESVSQEETIELIEDLFIMDIADKWVLSNNKSKSALENCWKVTKDYILYSEPPKNPITKLFIYIGKIDPYEKSYVYYKCDQFEGLLKFLKYYGLIN